MMQERRQAVLENLIYLIIWAILLVAPVLGFKYSNNAELDWNNVFRSWKLMTPFFILFLFNNYFLLPYLLLRKRTWWYLFAVILLTAVIFLFTPIPVHSVFPNSDRERMAPPILLQQEKSVDQPSEPKPQSLSEKKGRSSQPGYTHGPKHGSDRGEFRPDKRWSGPRDPFFFYMSPLLKFLMMAVLVIGLNIAIKLMFRFIREGQRMKELEKQTLQTELEYLKHQINPHFFMNTLNNIHALIDIDAEKAKETVLDLSKMMRYVLYDTTQAKLPLDKELRFLGNYIDLMKLRYTDQVDIRVHFPKEIPPVQISPLLFISFLENAFKHGVSYQHKSYIYCSVRIIDNTLEYIVENSKMSSHQSAQESGIGMENVQKRLRLLYQDNYTLDIQDEEQMFKIQLIIPV